MVNHYISIYLTYFLSIGLLTFGIINIIRICMTDRFLLVALLSALAGIAITMFAAAAVDRDRISAGYMIVDSVAYQIIRVK